MQPYISAEPTYPLVLASIASTLRSEGHGLTVVDLQFDSSTEVVQQLSRRKPDWIGVSALPHTVNRVREIVRLARSVADVPVFLAGAYPTLNPEDALMRTGADVAIVGPPEATTARLIRSSRPRSLPGVVVWFGDGFQTNVPARKVPVRDLPPMDRELFPVSRYGAAMRSTAVPYTMLLTSRGCPRACSHCPVPALHPEGFDARTPEQVVREMRELSLTYGIRSFHIEDDAFLANRARVEEICALLTRRPLDVVWELVNGVSHQDVEPRLLRQMARAGCRRIVYSFEHFGQARSSAGGLTFRDAQRIVLTTRAEGIRVGGYFMVGLPGVGLRESITSILWALRLGLDDSNFTPYHRLPGSRDQHNGARSSISTEHKLFLARAAQMAFFHHPRAFLRFMQDLALMPEVLPTMVNKSRELMRGGGPVPMREMW